MADKRPRRALTGPKAEVRHGQKASGLLSFGMRTKKPRIGAMDLGYRFSRSKVPRGFSYPMKRSVLDAAIAARGVHSVASVVFYFQRGPESILTVTYTGEQNDGILKPGTFSIWIYAVPSIERSTVQESIMRFVIPTALDWIVEIDHAGNVRRTGNHHFAARLIEGEALIQRD